MNFSEFADEALSLVPVICSFIYPSNSSFYLMVIIVISRKEYYNLVSLALFGKVWRHASFIFYLEKNRMTNLTQKNFCGNNKVFLSFASKKKTHIFDCKLTCSLLKVWALPIPGFVKTNSWVLMYAPIEGLFDF